MPPSSASRQLADYCFQQRTHACGSSWHQRRLRFVEFDQKTKVKLDAYPFRKYRMMDGVLRLLPVPTARQIYDKVRRESDGP